MSYVSDKKVILAILIFFFVISLSKSNVESNKKGNDDVKEQIEKLLKDDAAVDIKTTEFLATTESISLDNAHKPEESKKPSISVAGIDDDGRRTDWKSANISSTDGKKSEEKSKTNIDDDSSNNEEVDLPKKNVSETVEEAFLPAEVSANKYLNATFGSYTRHNLISGCSRARAFKFPSDIFRIVRIGSLHISHTFHPSKQMPLHSRITRNCIPRSIRWGCDKIVTR